MDFPTAGAASSLSSIAAQRKMRRRLDGSVPYPSATTIVIPMSISDDTAMLDEESVTPQIVDDTVALSVPMVEHPKR